MIEYTVNVFEDRTEWRNKDGQLHREDGPAIENVYGTKEWYINGKLHREDGPAIEWKNGAKAWHLNGKFHREDGPAFEDGVYKTWYINGKEYTESEYEMEISKRLNTCSEKVVEL